MQTENHYTETDLGNISPNPRGDYDNAARYEFLDLVTLQGGSYLCVIPVGQFLTGTAPEPGKTTEYWQCLAMPGDMTPQYTDAHDKVVRLAKEVAKDAEQVTIDKQSVTQMETDTGQLKMQAEESARQAESSKDSAAGYAKGAADAAQRVGQAEKNVGILVNGFDVHVEAKKQETAQAVQDAQTKAIQAVERQEASSVQEVKNQTGAYITEQKEAAKQELDNKVNQFGLDVNAIKKQVTDEGTKQVKAVQDASTAETTKLAEKGTEQAGFVTAEGEKQVQAVQTAAQEIIADREQIKANKTGIAELMQGKANAIVDKAKGNLLNIKDSSEAFFEDFTVYGKTEQTQTVGKNLLDIESGTIKDYNIEEVKNTLVVGKTYIYSVNNLLGDGTSACALLVVFADGGEQNLTGYLTAGTSKTFTLPEKEVASIKLAGNKSGILDKCCKLQVQEGATVTAWEPYTGGKPSPSPEYPQEIVNGELTEIKVTGINLLKQPYSLLPNDKTINGIQVHINEDFSITLKGTATQETYINLDSITDKFTTNGTAPFTNNGYSLVLSGTKKSRLKYSNFNNLVFINIPNGQTVDETVYPMITLEANKDKSYEPYKEQIVSFNPPVRLSKWDRLERKNSAWGWLRNGETKTYNGSENWEIWGEKAHTFSLRADKLIIDGLCSHFAKIGNTELDKKTGIYLYTTSSIIITKMDISTLEEWKAWLQANPITVSYATNIENFVPLKQEEQEALNALHTNYPNTVVSNSGNMDMELSYVADTKNYIDRKIKEAVSMQIQNTANLLSLMPLSTQAAMIENDTNNILDNMEVTK